MEERLNLAVIVPYDVEICKRYADIGLAKTADNTTRNVPANDRWIAACAIRHGLKLVTNNRKDYEGIPGLEIISEAPQRKIPKTVRLIGMDDGPADPPASQPKAGWKL